MSGWTAEPARIADPIVAVHNFATTYPNVVVDGYDLDDASIAVARANAVAAGVDDRVQFEARDAAASDVTGNYDLVMRWTGPIYDLCRRGFDRY